MTVVKRTFGPRYSEHELRQLNYSSRLGDHAGCWANSWCCEESDCVMGERTGEPQLVRREERSLR